MNSTMRDSSDSERSYLYQFSTSSPPPTSPPKLLSPPKSSPPEPAIKKEARELCEKLLYLRRHKSIGKEISQQFRVPPELWLALQDELLLSDEKLRCHYEAQNQSLELKMAEPIHDKIGYKFGNLVVKKVTALVQGVPADAALQAMVDKLENSGEIKVTVFGTDSRYPDIAIDSGEYPPTLVGEVGHSENGEKSFPKRADIYIIGTKGRVKTMIGIDIEYRHPEQRKPLRLQPRKATYQIFRSSIDGEGQLFVDSPDGAISFQNEEGPVRPRAHLRLSLADLMPSTTVPLSDYNIKISHQELCNIMEASEDYQEKADDFKLASTPASIDDNDRSSSSLEANDDKDTAYVEKRARHTSDNATSVSKRQTRSSGNVSAPTSEDATPVGARTTRNSKRGRAESGEQGSGVAAKRTKNKKC
ncbi:hypothetical protein J4E85_011110 [Alternaria conjuncta]|uniref:uncharacterized protein n=1 Tax=Alternaria conjuncta TaxID=181017 RepID=UPI00221E8EA6|nr:uncharacterized protein J4E85_011110 [Alternaria conjuncta]KAI4912176.1 hypothetical protein J4E85_011110 [Alternaria conjuncta]